MTMTPPLRKLTLTVHVISSVGWIGAVAAFLALAVAGLNGQDAQITRAAYLAMELITRSVIIPFSFVSLLTGLIISLGTRWGLFRHYWILVKFLITIPAIILLLVHSQPISFLADAAAEMALSVTDFRGLQLQLLAASGAALLVLLLLTTLAVYKPQGLTSYGWHKQNEQRKKTQP